MKYFFKKGISPKEIHEDFMETPERESPSYSTVEKMGAKFKRGRESVEDCLTAPKMPPLIKMSRSCTS